MYVVLFCCFFVYLFINKYPKGLLQVVDDKSILYFNFLPLWVSTNTPKVTTGILLGFIFFFFYIKTGMNVILDIYDLFICFLEKPRRTDFFWISSHHQIISSIFIEFYLVNPRKRITPSSSSSSSFSQTNIQKIFLTQKIIK